MNKKFELMQEPEYIGKKEYHRIKALRDIECFGEMSVKAGDGGGLIENEDSLSQDDRCWIYKTGCVEAGALIKDNAFVGGMVEQGAIVSGNAIVWGENSIVRRYAQVCDDVKIFGYVNIRERSKIKNDVKILSTIITLDLGCQSLVGRQRITKQPIFIENYGITITDEDVQYIGLVKPFLFWQDKTNEADIISHLDDKFSPDGVEDLKKRVAEYNKIKDILPVLIDLHKADQYINYGDRYNWYKDV